MITLGEFIEKYSPHIQLPVRTCPLCIRHSITDGTTLLHPSCLARLLTRNPSRAGKTPALRARSEPQPAATHMMPADLARRLPLSLGIMSAIAAGEQATQRSTQHAPSRQPASGPSPGGGNGARRAPLAHDRPRRHGHCPCFLTCRGRTSVKRGGFHLLPSSVNKQALRF